ncbi:dTDP-4-dehydrorhamnose reductase [Alkalitalea saponilacus]|uniref:dTDP-4-dehydrorhamnose reductase n=1 Tax=Alkalitalea saponilacus TaxID=889453 RepID=A0A1T5H9K6_9BACT|nr:dTDP-4-dehydrorhamnose reductase [Alkalitalea saponilacus]ASB50818.1 dTDP-4-dehydrorhamnose reductase [Alkalitalea saponilacus]SKC17358.1 dTDP-4-dehydrorhamnose reductase [Alkalitalea saponilacus]
MQVLIVGGEGQLGSSLEQRVSGAGFKSVTITRQEQLDISSEKCINDFLKIHDFDILINCAAYTAVDKAETDMETAHTINALAPGWMASCAAEKNAGIIHVSTDYVFDGTSNLPLTPEMDVNPTSVYGKTKLQGERNVLYENSKSLVIRTSWLYSEFGHNFVKTMLRLGWERDELRVVFDQIGTPTYAGDLADTIIKMLQLISSNPNSFNSGIYHYSNEGVCSWYDFAKMIFSITGIDCKVLPVRSEEFPTAAKRPAFSVMDKSKIRKDFDIEIPYWIDSLKACLNNIIHS